MGHARPHALLVKCFYLNRHTMANLKVTQLPQANGININILS